MTVPFDEEGVLFGVREVEGTYGLPAPGAYAGEVEHALQNGSSFIGLYPEYPPPQSYEPPVKMPSFPSNPDGSVAFVGLFQTLRFPRILVCHQANFMLPVFPDFASFPNN